MLESGSAMSQTLGNTAKVYTDLGASFPEDSSCQELRRAQGLDIHALARLIGGIYWGLGIRWKSGQLLETQRYMRRLGTSFSSRENTL